MKELYDDHHLRWSPVPMRHSFHFGILIVQEVKTPSHAPFPIRFPVTNPAHRIRVDMFDQHGSHINVQRAGWCSVARVPGSVCKRGIPHGHVVLVSTVHGVRIGCGSRIGTRYLTWLRGLRGLRVRLAIALVARLLAVLTLARVLLAARAGAALFALQGSDEIQTQREWTHHSVYFVLDRSLGGFDGLAVAHEADFALNVGAGSL